MIIQEPRLRRAGEGETVEKRCAWLRGATAGDGKG